MHNTNINHSSNRISLNESVKEQFKKLWLTNSIGILFLVVGICFLFWNEGKAVKISYSLDEAFNNIIIVNDNKYSAQLEGHLIYINGPIEVSEPLTEPDYGVMISSIKLKRRVQMYQWVEIEEERDFAGSLEKDKHYYYTTEWKDKLIDSDSFYIRFGHENPKKFPLKTRVQIADDARIGDFIFSLELKKQFNEYIEITSDERPELHYIKMHSGLYYHTADLWNPEVGDLRIHLSYAGKAGDEYSIIGKIENNVIVPFFTTHGEQILMQRKHKVTVDEMFHLEHVHNYWRTWFFRAVGWLVLYVASTCLADVLKIIVMNSSSLRAIIRIESLTLSVSISISLLIVGFAWVWYRPFIGLGLAIASILPFIYSNLMQVDDIPPIHNRGNYRRI